MGKKIYGSIFNFFSSFLTSLHSYTSKQLSPFLNLFFRYHHFYCNTFVTKRLGNEGSGYYRVKN